MVESDAASGATKALVFNGKRIGIEQGQRPQVQNINGQNLIGGMVSSLKKLTLADGTTRLYDFAVNDKLQPTLKIQGAGVPREGGVQGLPAVAQRAEEGSSDGGAGRLMVWDPKTRMIVSDSAGNWIYDIKPDEKNPLANAAIGRKNSQGQTEFWHYDGAKGQEIARELNGIKRVVLRFVSGSLTGKLRREEIMDNNKTVAVKRWSYDGTGRLLREFLNYRGQEYVTSFVRDDSKNQITFIQNGEVLWTNVYDDERRLVARQRPEKKEQRWRYVNNHSLEY